MRSLKSNSFNLSRRRMLATAAAAAATFPSAAKAGWNLKQEPSIAKLVEALRFIGKPVCVTAADSLATSTDLRPGFDLHLRNANLHDKDAQVLATGLRHLDADRDTPLTVIQRELQSWTGRRRRYHFGACISSINDGAWYGRLLHR